MVIRFFASIRNITGAKEIEWGELTPTLGELLRLLSERYGPGFRGWVLEGEGLGGSVMVVINGEDARHQGGVETRLAPTDVISILPIMAGGNLAAETRREPSRLAQDLHSACIEVQGRARRIVRAGLPCQELLAEGERAVREHRFSSYGKVVAHGIGKVLARTCEGQRPASRSVSD